MIELKTKQDFQLKIEFNHQHAFKNNSQNIN